MRARLITLNLVWVLQAFKEIEAGLDVSLEEVFAREHDPFTVNDGTDGMGGKVITLRDIIASYREAAMDRLQAEGFYNSEGRLFTAIQEEKKASQQVQTQEDLGQFKQQQDDGSFDNEALQNLIDTNQ